MKKSIICFLTVCLVLFTGCNKKEYQSDGIIENSGFENSLNYWNVKSNGITVVGNDNKYLMISNNNSTESINQKIKNLKPGYYSLTVKSKNDCKQDYCYVYGKGSSQEAIMTSIPLTYDDNWKNVMVNGIKVENDGLLEIGIKSFGITGKSLFDDFDISYEGDSCNSLLLGGAISWLDWEESLGAKYYDFLGNENDALQILKENGSNCVRLELYNNPGEFKDKDGNYFPKDFKNQDSILELAKRAKDLDMAIQLSFMYSDYWGNDSFPVDWKKEIDNIEGYDNKVNKLMELVYNYTYNYMKRMVNNGIFIEFVSLGNEIEPGILLPYGSSTDSDDSIKTLAKLLNSGYNAVKDASPSTKVILHIGCNANDMHWESKKGTGKWFFDLMKNNNVKYDIIGTSFYPYWAQTDNQYAIKKALTIEDFASWCEMMYESYNKQIIVMETGYNWGKPCQLANNGAYEHIYESTPYGQRNYMYDLINTIKCLKGKCIGCLYWDPVLVKQNGIGYALYDDGNVRPNVVETTTFFDYDHNALPVLDAYKYN